MKLHYNRLAVVVGVLIIIVGLAAFALTSDYKSDIEKDQLTADQVFDRFLEDNFSAETVTVEEEYSGTGSKVKSKGSLDAKAKKLNLAATLSCTATIDEKPVTVNLSLQQENANFYIRIVSAEGSVTNYETGRIYELKDVYSDVAGQWYELDKDPTVESQLDSGVYVFATAIYAPSYDKAEALEIFKNKGVFNVLSSSMDDENYVINMRVSKTAYLEALKEAFPNLSNPDLVLDNAFGENDFEESTLTITRDGKLISERLSSSNLCPDMIEAYIGEQYSGVPQTLTGTSKPLPIDSFEFSPIKGAKPINDLFTNMNL